MVGVPMLKAERISRSGPKLSDAQTRNFEAIKYIDESAAGKMREEASTWCPKWPEPEKKNGSKPGGKFSGLSLD